MAYIALPEGIPGIRGLVMYRPETGQHLYSLAQALLRGESPLTEAEREMIAAYVSSESNCSFCMNSHAAAARFMLNDDKQVVDLVLKDYRIAPISDKMKALLNIAGKVQRSGKEVLPEDIARARAHEATDREIHDTVLIAASFCMFNRYVDGLATLTPTDPTVYEAMGKRMGETGYVLPKNPLHQ